MTQKCKEMVPASQDMSAPENPLPLRQITNSKHGMKYDSFSDEQRVAMAYDYLQHYHNY